MHIVIGIISALAGLIWAINSLQRSGFRLSSINPFYWARRNKWKKQYAENPLYSLTDPMEVAAALMLGVAKLEGEISREQKQTILAVFSDDFGLTTVAALDLFSSTSFMLQKEVNFLENCDKILENVKEKFSIEQAESTIELVEKMANLDSAASDTQTSFLAQMTNVLKPKSRNSNSW
ncbi:MAG: TerB family tellurite resistance protein [Kangiellaceae bacterium]|nr:TerB family tellurite resistance protein [Kangiellaceae bacterium]